MSDDTEVYDLCIIGAGIAGLNALVVATAYLSRSDRVILADSRPGPGGMWVDTYDYVRLHQPHGIFTAGNIRWELGKPKSHLATKPEVLDHLAHCLAVAEGRVALERAFGWRYVDHQDVDGQVLVTLESSDGHTRTLRTRRLIKAFGHRIRPNDALTTSSTRVRSTTPEALGADAGPLRDDDAPIWIIGSGKTAMDTAHLLIDAFPGRSINMLAGPGTVFAHRDQFFPIGSSRWWTGTPINTMLRELGSRFDGTNEDDVREWYEATYGIGPIPAARNFISAYLSEAELTAITAGLTSVEAEYFSDAVDRGDEVELVLRSGDTRPTPAGTWLVNCTGSLLRESHPYEPFLSAAGTTMSIQMRSSATGIFSAFAGYYLTHLFLRGDLGKVGLYALDVEELGAKDKTVVTYASMCLALHNLSLLTDALPKMVIMNCGLDFDRWYPFPRRLLGMMAFLRTHRRDRDRHRRTLDTVADRFGVRGGPLLVP